jgi:hypothetical protein
MEGGPHCLEIGVDMSLRDALDRTLRLMRDELVDATPDDMLVAALTETEVALVADAANLASHSAQTAYVTAALLMARSGHRVHLLAPDIPLLGTQPPLPPGGIITGLLATGLDLLPGIAFSDEMPVGKIDLVVALGDSKTSVLGHQIISLNAGDWDGALVSLVKANRWRADRWPLGGMVAAAMVATEAFKIAMRKLEQHARNPALMLETFAPSTDVRFALAPADTPMTCALGEFDCVSGGAITQSVLYTLTRVPGVCGHARVIEPESADLTNLNRYMLLLHSHLGAQKAEDLKVMCSGTALEIAPIPKRYEPESIEMVSLREVVLVGVDDIPSRWMVQRAGPAWLGVGATTHWSAMASFHMPAVGGCAECLHPRDDTNNAPIPTVAFVSFWAGLLTAGYFLRRKGGKPSGAALDQQIYLTCLRPENPMWAAVSRRLGCKTCAALDAETLSA